MTGGGQEICHNYGVISSTGFKLVPCIDDEFVNSKYPGYPSNLNLHSISGILLVGRKIINSA